MKKISAFIAVVGLLVSVSAPAYAAPNKSARAINTDDIIFCNSVSTLDATLTKLLAAEDSKIATKRANAGKRLTDLRASEDQRLADARKKSDTKWANEFERLANKADSDLKKQAVESYKTKTLDLLNKRRDANARYEALGAPGTDGVSPAPILTGGALFEFRTGQDKAIANHRKARDEIRAKYVSAVHEAAAKAVKDCGADTTADKAARKAASKSIEKQFLASINKAKKDYNVAIAQLPSVNKKVAELKQVLVKARAENNKAFNTDQKQLLKDLNVILNTNLRKKVR